MRVFTARTGLVLWLSALILTVVGQVTCHAAARVAPARTDLPDSSTPAAFVGGGEDLGL